MEQNDTGYMGCGSGCEVNRTTQGTWHVGQGDRSEASCARDVSMKARPVLTGECCAPAGSW